MIPGVELLPEAEEDIYQAYKWYRSVRAELADDFAASLRQCLLRIAEYPNANPAVGKGLRKARPRRFPYQVYYRMLGNKVIVYSVHHDSKNPNEWKKRV